MVQKTQQQGPTRFEVIQEGQKHRYWDPKDGQYTHPLAANPSAKIFYTEKKGFMMKPAGKLAWYVNLEAQNSQSPDPLERARRKAKAVAGPFPIGEKETICNCKESNGRAINCATWEDHYRRYKLEFMRLENEPEPARELSSDDVASIVKSLATHGYEVIKSGKAQKGNGNNDNSQKKSTE